MSVATEIRPQVGLGGTINMTRTAERVDGRFRVNGRAGFGTMSACADYVLQTAYYDDPENGPRCLALVVSKEPDPSSHPLRG